MKKHILLIPAAIFIVCFCLYSFSASAQTNQTSATSDAGGDAIAVRIVPNPNHYSIQRWYESQGFQGSPQSLVVDGYQAVRDGRTVYVNAANIDTTGNTQTIYTNIYLISYNQDPVPNTVDILGQIVSHWKFNANLVETSSPLPSCAISSLSCSRDADCGAGEICATSGLASSSCELTTVKNCTTDTDCPANFFCNSVKAKITRDVARVGELEDLKEALFNYKSTSALYPSLAAGSYIANHSVSVWPSWTAALLSNLSLSQSFLDPINRLGACSGYDLKTCWNESAKSFWNNQNSGSGNGIWKLTLPPGSYALAYQSDSTGSNYNICAVIESHDLGWRFSPNDPATSNCVVGTGVDTGGSATNTAPRLVASSLSGVAGQEFNGSLQVVDDQNNPLSWNFDTSATNWTGWQNTSGNAPILKATSRPDQKKVYALQAGQPGNYDAVLTVNDGQGGVLTTTTQITIINPAPAIQAADGQFILDPLLPFDYNFTFSGANIINPASAYSVVKVSGPFDLLNNAGLVKTQSSAGIAKYKVDYQGLISLSHQFSKNTDFVYQITVTDKYNTVATKNFTIHIIVENPGLGFTCDSSARVNQPYNCFIGSNKQGDHTLAYASNALPANLLLASSTSGTQINSTSTTNLSRGRGFLARVAEIWRSILGSQAALAIADFNNFIGGGSTTNGGGTISTSTPPTNIYLDGYLSATSTGWPINIQAVNEYGATSSRDFSLKINDYCGDGKLESPNMEARGGFYNDGYEDCDGNAGVTTNVASSSIALQYGCETEVGSITPSIIPNNNYCVFKSPLAGGGYCGDGYCQVELVTGNTTSTLETSANCPADCAAAPVPSCNAHQHMETNGCACDAGWYNCDGLDANGCESATVCATCQPSCTGKVCGDDGCSGSCGTCTGNNICKNGQCVPPCTSGCNNITCGQLDSCTGLTCGCTYPQTCASNGLCCSFDNNGGCNCGPTLSAAYTKCGTACCANLTTTCCNGTCAPLGSTECGANCCGPAQKCCGDNTCHPRNYNCPV